MEEQGNNGCLSTVGVILFIAFILFALRGFKNPKDDYSQAVGGFLGIGYQYPSKIMNYSGSQLMLVCKRPYSNEEDCYYLQVSSNGEIFTRIWFPNGGYIEILDVECFEMADIYGNKGDYKFFCNTYDRNGEIWDVFLPYANI